jgi:hypothetical protein
MLHDHYRRAIATHLGPHRHGLEGRVGPALASRSDPGAAHPFDRCRGGHRRVVERPAIRPFDGRCATPAPESAWARGGAPSAAP